MARATANPGIDALMSRASDALAATEYFEAAALSLKALRSARRLRDYERMARICLPLQESRRQLRAIAVDAGLVLAIRSFDAFTLVREPGCYMVEPPLVGIDATVLRSFLAQARVPALVLAREPRTSAGLWPVVAVGGGEGLPVVIRVRLTPPPDERPDPSWMLAAQESLGDAAIVQVRQDWPADHRVDDLLERLEGIPDHEKLIQALEGACREAMRLDAPSPPRRRAPMDNPHGF